MANGVAGGDAMTVAPHWTAKQEQRLREMYPRYPRYQIEQALAPHTWQAIRGRANQLGIPRASMHRDWMKIAREHKPTFAFGKDEW